MDLQHSYALMLHVIDKNQSCMMFNVGDLIHENEKTMFSMFFKKLVCTLDYSKRHYSKIIFYIWPHIKKSVNIN